MNWPIFPPSAGTGNVIGPGSSTVGNLARWDATNGQLLKDSPVVVSDAGEMSGLTGLEVASGNADFRNGSNAEFFRVLSNSGDINLGGVTRNCALRFPPSTGPSGDLLMALPAVSGVILIDTSGTGAPASSQATGIQGEFRRVAGFCYYCFSTGSSAADRWARWAVTTSF